MNARISPVASAMIIFGIIMLGALPPIGMALFLGAWLVQRSYRRQVLDHRHARRAAAAEREEREMMLAAKAFLR